MVTTGLILVALAALILGGMAVIARRPAMVQRLGRNIIAGPVAALVFLVVGFILIAVGASGFGRIAAIVGAVLAIALVGSSGALLLLRLRAPRVENVSVSNEGLVLVYSTGPITVRWEDITSLEAVQAQGAIPAGISYKMRKGSASEKAIPFATRMMSKLARQPFDGLLALPGGPREVEAMLKRLRRYWREPGARRELPSPGGSIGAPPTMGDTRRMTSAGGARQQGGVPPKQGGVPPRQGNRRRG